MARNTPRELLERLRSILSSLRNVQITFHVAAGKVKRIEIREYLEATEDFSIDSALSGMENAGKDPGGTRLK